MEAAPVEKVMTPPTRSGLRRVVLVAFLIAGAVIVGMAAVQARVPRVPEAIGTDGTLFFADSHQCFSRVPGEGPVTQLGTLEEVHRVGTEQGFNGPTWFARIGAGGSIAVLSTTGTPDVYVHDGECFYAFHPEG